MLFVNTRASGKVSDSKANRLNGIKWGTCVTTRTKALGATRVTLHQARLMCMDHTVSAPSPGLIALDRRRALVESIQVQGSDPKRGVYYFLLCRVRTALPCAGENEGFGTRAGVSRGIGNLNGG